MAPTAWCSEWPGTVSWERDIIWVRGEVRGARGAGPGLAPRSVRHIYAALHQVLHDAVVDEVILSNPCVLKRGEVPAKIDGDPMWRPTAVFTREEIETLISDERVPEDRRVLYALEFLTGMRMGEAAALAWRAYDATLAPLGRLLVATSYNTRNDRVKSTKTERPREVPVHATLASVLAAWKLSGWRRMMGRPAAADDLIVPARGSGHRNVSYSLKVLHEDLELLGLRKRRHCDTRRTFAQADGARKDVLRWVTHGPTGDIVDLYTTLPWSTLCEAVVCLRIGMRGAKVLQLRPAAAESGRGVGDILETAAPAQTADEEKARRSVPSGP